MDSLTDQPTTLPPRFLPPQPDLEVPPAPEPGPETKTTTVPAAAGAALEASSGTASRKLRAAPLARALFGALANPLEWWRAARLQLARRAHRHSFDDAQLSLYARVLPTGFLHFGYFDDPHLRPEDMSLAGLEDAQKNYADLVLEHAGDPAEPVLDVGCGMGGLSRMLRERGFRPVALTPDRGQAAHVRATLPGVPVVRCKFERLPAAEHAGRYGTVFTAESLQYLKLDASLPLLASVLRSGGRWVACDFFHARPSADRSCHE